MQHPIVRNDPKLFSNERESLYFDRKSARLNAKEVARHICAFANASGGKLVIGIEDDGEITGFRRNGARDIEDFEQAPVTGCNPVPVVHATKVPVTNSKGQLDQILVLDGGRIVGCGTHSTLLRSCETYREIALSQLSAAELGEEG